MPLHYEGHELVTDLSRTNGNDGNDGNDEGYAIKRPDGSLVPIYKHDYVYRVDVEGAEPVGDSVPPGAMVKWVGAVGKAAGGGNRPPEPPAEPLAVEGLHPEPYA